jgi:hypothetical protein
MDHKTSPLFDMKMPKVKPIAKLVETYFKKQPHMTATKNK